MCQSRKNGGRRCMAHCRAAEAKRARRVWESRVREAVNAEHDAQALTADAVMLTEDVESAREEGVPWSLEPAEADAQYAVEKATRAREYANAAAIAAGLSDVKSTPQYRRELMDVLPNGEQTTLTVDGEQVTADQVADRVAEAQQQAARRAGDAAQHRMFDRTDEAEESERDADTWRERAGHLAAVLGGALVDGVTLTADAVTAPVRAVGSVLREVAAETAESMAEAVGIAAVPSHGSEPHAGNPTADADADADEADAHQPPLTREQRQVAREAAEAREIERDAGTVKPDVDPDGEPDVDTDPVREQQTANAEPEREPTVNTEPTPELTADEQAEVLAAVQRGDLEAAQAVTRRAAERRAPNPTGTRNPAGGRRTPSPTATHTPPAGKRRDPLHGAVVRAKREGVNPFTLPAFADRLTVPRAEAATYTVPATEATAWSPDELAMYADQLTDDEIRALLTLIESREQVTA